MNFSFSADIDAACGLISDQHPWLTCQPFGKKHFLLVAAAKAGYRLLNRAGFYIQGLDGFMGQAVFSGAIHK